MVFHRAKTMVTVQYLRFSEPRSATLDAVSNVAPGREYGVLPPGYRLPDQTRVGRVRLQVGDLDRSVGYYRDVLGFRTIEAHGRCELAPQGDDHVIAELHEFHGARHVPPGGLLGLYHFAVLLPDRAALGRLVRYLLKAGMQFGSADHAVSESIYLWDPDGLGIEIYADRPRASWQTRGRELMMGTDLLDLQSLVALADGDWTGIPMGTTRVLSRWPRPRRRRLELPWRPVSLGGRLPSSPRHQHLGGGLTAGRRKRRQATRVGTGAPERIRCGSSDR
jgi:catechol 2,3-dioxygenase-like lactoylglutathione lyase family enzyme